MTVLPLHIFGIALYVRIICKNAQVSTLIRKTGEIGRRDLWPAIYTRTRDNISYYIGNVVRTRARVFMKYNYRG